MSDIASGIYTAVREVVAATWPEVVKTGIYEGDQADTIPWDQLIPPRAVIVVDGLPPSTAWGTTVDAFTPEVSVYYVMKIDATLTPLREKIDEIAIAFNNATGLTIVQNMGFNWGSNLPANQFLAAKNSRIKAARYKFKCLVGRPFRSA